MPMKNYPIKLQKALMLTVLIEKYYESDSAGGCLHVLLDDHNYGRDTSWLQNFSKEKGDYWGELIAILLSEFTEEEQEKIVERPWEIEAQV